MMGWTDRMKIIAPPPLRERGDHARGQQLTLKNIIFK